MRRFVSAVCVVLVAGACAAEDPVATEPRPDQTVTIPSENTTTTAALVETPDASVVTIEGFSFGPPVDVPVGSTITVVNRDPAVHTWTSDDGLFDSGNLATDEEFTHVFDTPGEFGFFCVIHPGMTGSITVSG